jgi:hypothetical protein
MTEPLRSGDVVAIYEQLLGRTPRPDEIDHQLATASDVADLLRIVLESAEYAAHAGHPPAPPPREQRTTVNIYHPDLSAWSHQAGCHSPDGVAIVGHEGWVFLCSGSNSVVEQFSGAEPKPGWLDGWRSALRLRAEQVDGLGARMVVLVVPDKLSVYESFYPEPIVPVGPRPIQRLLDGTDVPITYPIADLQLRSLDVPVFLRTDTHLTFHGNAALYDAVRAQLDAPALPADIDPAAAEHLISGDLGARYDPQIVEVVANAGSLGAARVTADNRREMETVGGHIGTRRVFANDSAPDRRTVVLFGDSFGFSSPSYQGLSWFLAQAFREVHFVWVPFGWDPDYTSQVAADIVIFQGAERFLTRVPLDAVKAADLAAETLRRKQGLDLGAAFNS